MLLLFLPMMMYVDKMTRVFSCFAHTFFFFQVPRPECIVSGFPVLAEGISFNDGKVHSLSVSLLALSVSQLLSFCVSLFVSVSLTLFVSLCFSLLSLSLSILSLVLTLFTLEQKAIKEEWNGFIMASKAAGSVQVDDVLRFLGGWCGASSAMSFSFN